MFSTLKNISQRSYSSLRVFSIERIFSIEEYKGPCELTETVFLHLKMFFYLKNIHLYGSWQSWKYYIPEECTPLCECFSIGKYLPLCVYTKMVFSKLKMSSTQRIYTSVQIFFNKECSPLFRWLKWCFLHLKILSTRRI